MIDPDSFDYNDDAHGQRPMALIGYMAAGAVIGFLLIWWWAS